MKKKSLYKFIPLFILFVAMYMIHRYIFIYADDLYYSRDAQYGLSYLPEFMLKQLNINGRVWVHVLLSFLLKYDVLLFRIVNPIIISLTVLLIAKICIHDNEKNKNIFPAILVSSVLFLALHTPISSTTIYYAACALNYLYPTLVAILFGYLLFKYYSNTNNNSKISLLIVIVAFFAGSSTQQAGMIAIGFAVLITLYLIFVKKYRFRLNYSIYFISLFLGYGLVTYGSIKRMLFEQNSGVVIKITDTITEMLKSNVFSKPVSIFVLLICISCIVWLIKFIIEGSKSKLQGYFNIILAITLCISSLCYIYVVIIKGFNVVIFDATNVSLKVRLFYLGFTVLYLFSILYIGTLILLNKNNPFILSCIINAIGAQAMLLVADSRFAGSYKIVFPSLLLMFIFISYTFSELYNGNSIKFNKVVFTVVLLPFMIISFKVYYQNYKGYKNTSKEIVYNLNAIKEYNKSSDKSILTLKKVPPSLYGYNLGNWNDMPYFMKQCYKINENTIINYID
ncbi:hypothetical protein UT300007_02030 [Clostridium sp. CTA-7]